MSVTLLRGNALALPIAEESIDVICTSPPYFALRSYSDGGVHYPGQLGSEPSSVEFLDALLAATAEMVRVLKPSGSIWVNLGDKYAGHSKGTGGHLALSRTSGGQSRTTAGAPTKSLLGLPWRYAIRCMDELGLILRAEVIWAKPNGMPESVTDRVRRSHEQWFHFTKEARYFSNIDTIREAHNPVSVARSRRAYNAGDHFSTGQPNTLNPAQFVNPLGKLPGSVWSIPTQPLTVPADLGVDHFAAFPMELPRRIIKGWSPTSICLSCGEGRRVVASTSRQPDRPGRVQGRDVDALLGGHGADGRAGSRFSRVAVITGEECACPEAHSQTRPAVVLDPFGGTGTTAMVADALGRHGISVDKSGDYCRLAKWRTTDPKQIAKARQATPPPKKTTPSVGPDVDYLFT